MPAKWEFQRIAGLDEQATAEPQSSPTNKGQECYFRVKKKDVGRVGLKERPPEASGAPDRCWLLVAVLQGVVISCGSPIFPCGGP